MNFLMSLLGLFSEFGVTGILNACIFVFFAYIGFDFIGTVAQESKAPTRSIPIATIGSLVISLLIYIGICTVMVGFVPYESLDTSSPLSETV